MSTIAVIGLGYVGLPLAVEFGKKMKTVGFDLSPKRWTPTAATSTRPVK
jgi:UDP-N-acetyl-D-galactosamine dehydrogenase